jgi:uncharacterized RDD family membrane protein YckC
MIPTPAAYDEHHIRTSDNVVLGMAVAGIGSRLLAQIVDLLCLGVIGGLLVWALSAILSTFNVSSTGVLVILLSSSTLFVVGYFAIPEGLAGGRTIGKRTLGIRVVMVDGSSIGMMASGIRNTVRILEYAFLPITAIFMFFQPQSRRGGDLAAGTLVIRERTASSHGSAPWQQQFRAQSIPAPADLGATVIGVQGLTGRELGALRTYASRTTLHPAQRQRIAANLATRLMDRLNLPADAPERSEDPQQFLARLYAQLSQQNLI